MAELGEASAAYHAAIVALARDLGIEVLVLVGPQMGAAGGRGARLVDDADAASAELRQILGEGDVVLVKGSRSMELDRIALSLV